MDGDRHPESQLDSERLIGIRRVPQARSNDRSAGLVPKPQQEWKLVDVRVLEVEGDGLV